jgi:uncharacterized protein (DUF1501 family)
MKRRNFLKIAQAAGVTPFVVNGFKLKPFANSTIQRILNTCDGVEDRVLVLIQLKGGNDGINNLVPTAQYDKYAALRPTIKIDPSKLVDLDSTLSDTDKIGLHPALTPLKSLYDDGRAAIVQGVGYADMNRSHFKGTELWMSGGDSTPANFNISTGWMGRALHAFYPTVDGAPTTKMPDPLGIQIGDPTPALGFHTDTEHQNMINLSGQDAAGFYSLIQTIGGAPIMNLPSTDQGAELDYIMGVEQSVDAYAARITQVFNNGSNSITTYPTLNGNSLGEQLKTIARMIKGGCKTKIYLCQVGSFDTHVGQVIDTATETGVHANLLNYMSSCAKTFLDDLQGLGLDDQVVACTFSEFGRKVMENGSFGTDHGTQAPMYLFGKNIKSGVFGTNVDLTNITTDEQLQNVQFDYRRIFTSLLQDWLGATSDILQQTMFDGYVKMPVIDPAYVVDPSCYFGTTAVSDPAASRAKLHLYPNPASIMCEVSVHSDQPFDAYLTLNSLGGSLISGMPVRVVTGDNLFYLDVSSLAAGNYFVRLENRSTGIGQVTKLVVARS